jgi:hypothetical protein
VLPPVISPLMISSWDIGVEPFPTKLIIDRCIPHAATP